jgi:hypothetical protein
MRSWSIKFRITIFYCISFIVMCLFLWVSSVSAHVVKVDGSIGITVHIDPDDAPIANKENTIFVTIKDADKKFDEKNPIGCDCKLEIVRNGKIVSTLPITTGSAYNSLRHTFPSNGTYQIRVTGSPNGKGGQFQPFDAVFEYYVKSSGSAVVDSDLIGVDKVNPLLLYYPYLLVLGGGIILFMFLNPFKKKHE